jgi:ParB family chromosome partitioning protein
MNAPEAATGPIGLSYNFIDIPIKLLVPSKRNVRKSTPSKESHAELVAGIRAIGLLHPMTVVDNSDGLYGVIAGKRRLKAVQELVKEGHYTEDQTVTCRLLHDESDNLEEISLIENIQRTAMHPADEFEAYNKMRRNGATAKDIALHLGISEKAVYQRLKLGQVAPAILKAYRNEELNLAAVMAFTIEDDKARQLAVFEQMKSEPGEIWDRNVRRALKGDLISSDSGIGKFVGVKAYEKAGGAISHDLFREEAYFNDTDLLNSLAMAKLEKAAAELQGEWNWVEITLDDRDPLPRLNRIRAFDTQETAALREQLKVVTDTLETLERTVEMDNWTQEHDQQLQRLQDKEMEIEDAIVASQAFLPAEMQLAGCLVTFDRLGELEITRGLVRKADEKKLAELNAPDTKSKKSTSKKASAPEPDTIDEGDYSQALTADLTTYRLNIAKHYLAKDTALVQELLVYTLCCKTFEDFYYGYAVKVSIEQTNPESSLTQPDTGQAFASFKQRRKELSLDWLNIKADGERFEAFTALPCQDKLDLMAYCVARAFTINNIGNLINEVAEIVIRGLDIPWHKEFKPTAENYFNRLSKPQLIEHGKLFLDDDWPARAAKRSKKELANELEEVFAGRDQTMPADKRAAAADWVPEAFKTGTIA